MKIASYLSAFCLAALLLPLTAGCKSTKTAKAQKRSERIQPATSINEVYKLMGKPRETFAAVYAWEYTVSDRRRATNLVYRVEFEERNGRWVVRNARWK